MNDRISPRITGNTDKSRPTHSTPVQTLRFPASPVRYRGRCLLGCFVGFAVAGGTGCRPRDCTIRRNGRGYHLSGSISASIPAPGTLGGRSNDRDIPNTLPPPIDIPIDHALHPDIRPKSPGNNGLRLSTPGPGDDYWRNDWP